MPENGYDILGPTPESFHADFDDGGPELVVAGQASPDPTRPAIQPPGVESDSAKLDRVIGLLTVLIADIALLRHGGPGGMMATINGMDPNAVSSIPKDLNPNPRKFA